MRRKIRIEFNGDNETIIRLLDKDDELIQRSKRFFDKIKSTHLYYDWKTDNIVGTSIKLNKNARRMGLTILEADLIEDNEKLSVEVKDCWFYDGDSFKTMSDDYRRMLALKVVDGLKFENKEISLSKEDSL